MSQRPNVVVFDYGFGNVHSAMHGLNAAGADVSLSRDRAEILAADGLLVPGVGAFGAVMAGFNAAGGPLAVEQRLAAGRPVLGICVGMQIMFEGSTEFGSNEPGLGEFPGMVTELPAQRLPHMGWNTVSVSGPTKLFAGIADQRFYFVHSYAAREWTKSPSLQTAQPALAWAEHGGPFLAAVEQGPLSATQFHPEKSGEAGIQLLRNWIQSFPETNG